MQSTSVNDDDINDVVISTASFPRLLHIIPTLPVFITAVVVVVSVNLAGCAVGRRKDGANVLSLGRHVGPKQHLEARENFTQCVDTDQFIVSKSVGRQLVEPQELLFLLGRHVYVWNAQKRLHRPNETGHVVLVREEDATDGFQQDVLGGGVSRSTQRRDGTTAE